MSLEASRLRSFFIIVLSLAVMALTTILLPSTRGSADENTSASSLKESWRVKLEELFQKLQAGEPFTDIEADILHRFASGDSISRLEAELVISRAHYAKTILNAELSEEQKELLERYELEVLSLRTILPQAPPPNDTCAGAIPLSLNTPVTGTTVEAVNNYQLQPGSACFTGIGHTVNTAPGIDAVYSFTAPSTGLYSFRVFNLTTSLNWTIFLSNTCPGGAGPITITDASCLGAANRRTATDRAEEIHCVSLTAGQTVYLFVDDNHTTPGQPFTVEVIRCIPETESNNTTATANTFECGISGSIGAASDVDFFSLGTPAANSRLFAIIDASQSGSGANPDYILRVTTSTDTLEYDSNNNDFPFGNLSSNVAGTILPNTQVFLRINYNGMALNEPYRIYSVIQPPSSSATPEVEPNNSTAQANSSSINYFSGVIQTNTDQDFYSFTANAGSMIFVSVDADPLRNNTPFNPILSLLDSGGGTLITVNDVASTSNTTSGAGSLTSNTPFSPGEALLWRARYTGTYYVRVSRSSGTTPADYLLSIAATNCGIACPSFSISPTDLLDGTVGVPYTDTIMGNAPGVAPFVFAVTSGTLPPGLTLSASGTLSGTPTASGSFTFTVTASDVNNCQSSQTYTIDISSCPTITVSPASLPDGTIGVPYSQSLSASGGIAPYSFTVSSGTLPTGLTLSTGGLLSGTPTATGSFTFTVTATDSFGCTGSQSYTVNIVCPTITVSPTSLPDGTIGVPYSQTITASGGTAPYSFTVSSGTLPTGLTLSTGGLLSGTPTAAGTFTFTVTATDSFGCTGSQSYTVNIVCPTITVSPTSLPDGTTGVPYSQTITASGGTAPYSFTVSSGTLPTGLTLSTGGLLSGTPTAAGTFTFTVTATDSFGCTGSQSYTVNIVCPTITISPATLPGFIVGQPYSQTLSASGGTAPYTFSLTSGTLPPGIALSPSGVLSGIPTAGGLYTFTVTAIDAFGCSGSRTFQLLSLVEHISVYVADTNNHRIQRSTDDGATWEIIGVQPIVGPGTALGRFNAPQGVSANSNDTVIFVADTGNNRIQRSTDGGVTWEALTLFNGPSSAVGGVTAAQSIAYDEISNTLYVADTGNHRIQKVTGATTGSPVWSVMPGTGLGTGLGRFNSPSGIAVDISGNVYVSDTANNRIQRYLVASNTWEIFAGATSGTAVGKVRSPNGIFVDSTNRVWVADTTNNRIQVWNGGWSVSMGQGTGIGLVMAPEGVTVNANGNLFVGDTGNNRIQRRNLVTSATSVVGLFGTPVGFFHKPTGLR